MEAVLVEKEKIELFEEDKTKFQGILKDIYGVSVVVILVAAVLMVNIIKGWLDAKDFLENVVKYNQFAFTHEDIKDNFEDIEGGVGWIWTERYSTYSDPGNAYKVYMYGYNFDIEVVTNYEGYVLSVTCKSDTRRFSKDEKEKIKDAMLKCFGDVFDEKNRTLYNIGTAYDFDDLDNYGIKTIQSDWEIGFEVARG